VLAAGLVCGVVLAAAIVVLLIRGGTGHADLVQGQPQARTTPDPGVAAVDLLTGLQNGLRRQDRAEVLAAADSRDAAARKQLTAVVDNVRALRIRQLALRYVDTSDVALSPAQQERYGADAWVADVRVTWRLAGVDPAPSTVDVPVVLGRHGGRVAYEGALDAGHDQVPLWLLDRLVVRRTHDTLVVAPDRASADRAGREAVTAVATVRRTLPGWDGPLVVEVPAGMRQFQVSADMAPEDARAIAAVTTTTDGSAARTAPVHVYLNPPVFDSLGPQGRQIVLSHEATHVALGAATTSMPLWLSEGTADYVALAHSTVPVRTLASQIRALVRKDGPPAGLPGRPEFSGANHDIGAWYEASWLAARLIAAQHGPAALLRFYRAAGHDGSTGPAFRTVLHTTQHAFAREWRAELVGLAGS
jgi:hypothetical protein